MHACTLRKQSEELLLVRIQCGILQEGELLCPFLVNSFEMLHEK